MIAWAKRENKTIAQAIYENQRYTLNRLVSRVEKGYDFYLGTDSDGKSVIKSEKSNRKTLEEEYPALRKVAEQYDIIRNLIDSTSD